MDPSSGAALLTVQLIALVIELDQVPDDIRRCLELVRTCHKDTQHLIEMRNENIAILQQRPKELARVNDIIVSASNGLREVSELVEKCRPDAHKGRTHIGKRLWWTYVDRDLFHMQRPIVERHHTAVLSELSYVRQLGLMMPVIEMAKKCRNADQKRKQDRQAKNEFENFAMLDGLMGGTIPNHSRSPSFGQAPPPYRATPPSSMPSGAASINQSSHSAQKPSEFSIMAPSPVPGSPRPLCSPSRTMQPHLLAPEPNSMLAPVSPNQSQNIIPDTRSHLKAEPLSAPNFANTSMMQQTPKQSSGIDEEGLAALLGSSFPTTTINSTVVNQQTTINGPINITVNVNNYAGQPDSSTVSSTNATMADADIHSAISVVQSALHQVPLSTPYEHVKQAASHANDTSSWQFSQSQNVDKPFFENPSLTTSTGFMNQRADVHQSQTAPDGSLPWRPQVQPSYGLPDPHGQPVAWSNNYSVASMAPQPAAIRHGEVINGQNYSSSSMLASSYEIQPPSIMMAPQLTSSSHLTQTPANLSYSSQMTSPSSTVSPLQTPAPMYSQLPYPPPPGQAYDASPPHNTSVSTPVPTQPFSTIPSDMIYGVAAPAEQRPVMVTQPNEPWYPQYDLMYTSTAPVSCLSSPASIAAVPVTGIPDTPDTGVVSKQRISKAGFVCYELDSNRYEPDPVELE